MSLRSQPQRPAWVDPFAEACRAVAAGRNASQRLRQWGTRYQLGDLQLRLLHVLSRRSAPVDQASLAAELAASPARISAIVLQLGRAGQIVAVADPADRRRQLWRLTDLGCGTIAAVTAIAVADDTGDFQEPSRAREEAA